MIDIKHLIFFMIDIKIFTNWRGQGKGQEWVDFFDILLYYINVMIKTLYISCFIVVYII